MITKKEKLYLLIIYPVLSGFLGGTVFTVIAALTGKKSFLHL